MTSYVDQIGEYISGFLNRLYQERDADLRAAFAAWGQENLAEHACLMEREDAAPFGLEFDLGDDGVSASMERRVLVVDQRLRGIDYDGPTDPHEYAEFVLTAAPSSVDYTRYGKTYMGNRFLIALLHDEETRKLPPVEAVPTWRIAADDD